MRIEKGLHRGFPLIRSEKHRSHAALIGNSSATLDQIESLGHRRVCASNRIIHLIDDCGELKCHFQHAGLTDFDALLEGLVLTHQHAIFDVLADLPTIG